MKIFVAWAFTFLTISGAMIQSESSIECLDKAVEISAYSQNETESAVQTDRTPISKSQHSHSDSGHHDCHHNGSSCHSSHLGHSAFLISLAVSVPNADFVGFQFSSQIAANIFNLQANLFRPPIA